jgi:hypothetical protein
VPKRQENKEKTMVDYKVDYKQVLADLEARRDSLVADLDASIRTVRQILAGGQQPSQPHFRPTAVGGAENQTKLVFDYLVKEHPRSRNSKDVAAGTGLPEKAVRSILARLYKVRKIDRPSRGRFKAKLQAHDSAAA